MKAKIQKFRRFFFTRILVLFNLSAVAFTFQACYGVPQDEWMDVMITGYVSDAETREPISGIDVEVIKIGSAAITDEEGYFRVYAEQDSLYTLIFSDVDGEANGLYWDKTTSISDTLYSKDLSLKVLLNPKTN